MKYIFICLLAFVCTSMVPEQTVWNVLNIRGYSIDPITGEVDETEGFGAFDSLMKLFKPNCPKNFDNGGGAFDDTSRYVKEAYNIENIVYDPFMRSPEHNEKVLKAAQTAPFDCCTSISVLNVIDSVDARLHHVKICYDVIKVGESAFFKIWSGDKTGIAQKSEGRYQSNQTAAFYVDEVRQVFGDEVFLVDETTIKAVKR